MLPLLFGGVFIKNFSLLFLTLWIIFTFSGCESKPANNITCIPTYYGDVVFDENLFFQTEKTVYSKEESIIKYTITNTGKTESGLPAQEFALHKYYDGEWKFISFKYAQWNELYQLLPAGESTEGEINLEDFFEFPLDKGKYRLIKGNAVSNTFEITE